MTLLSYHQLFISYSYVFLCFYAFLACIVFYCRIFGVSNKWQSMIFVFVLTKLINSYCLYKSSYNRRIFRISTAW